MKKIFIALLLTLSLNSVYSQQLPTYYISVDKGEFKIVTGMCLVGIGMWFQPVFNSSRSFYHRPVVIIPMTLGVSLTISGLIDGIKKEKKYRESTKN